MKQVFANDFLSLAQRSGRWLMCAAAAVMLLVAGEVQANETAGESTPPQAANNSQVRKTVKGLVKDEAGEPLVGVSVIVKGTTTGVTTGIDGTYSIQATPSQTLVYSYIGMNSVEEQVGQRTAIDVVLNADGLEIEAVVAIGYGTSR